MSKEVGRYQGVRIDSSAILIIDTQEGHLWLWGCHKDTGFLLMYQGQVSPGEKPGDAIVQIPLNK